MSETTEKVRKTLARRYRAEKRFKAFGIGSIGIGFAIPINAARSFLEEVRLHVDDLSPVPSDGHGGIVDKNVYPAELLESLLHHPLYVLAVYDIHNERQCPAA